MRKNPVSAIIVIISAIIIVAVVVIAIKVVFGDDGVVSHYTEIDNEYNKTEVVEKLNLIIKQKYFEDYKYCLENKKNIEEVYNVDVALAYLLDNNYLVERKDIYDQRVENEFYVVTESLNRDIVSNEVKENGSEGDGSKIYIVRHEEDKYQIYFIDAERKQDYLGELIMKPEI